MCIRYIIIESDVQALINSINIYLKSIVHTFPCHPATRRFLFEIYIQIYRRLNWLIRKVGESSGRSPVYK